MSVLDLPMPQVHVSWQCDDDDVHVTCCDPDRALCGEPLEGEWADDDAPTDCIRCEAIDAAKTPCGVPFCRLRSWWRSR